MNEISKPKLTVFVVLLVLLGSTAFSGDLNEFQKQSIDLIKTFTLQLILIASGVFSLTGIYLLKNPTRFSWIGVPFIIIGSYYFFAYSIYRGFLVLGNIIQQLSGGSFDAHHEVLLKDARMQFYSLLVAGVIFVSAILVNFIVLYANRCCSKKRRAK